MFGGIHLIENLQRQPTRNGALLSLVRGELQFILNVDVIQATWVREWVVGQGGFLLLGTNSNPIVTESGGDFMREPSRG
jgi:hypothetical protein